MEYKNFNIIIQYKLDGENLWKTFNITPEEYFDLEEDELIEVDSVPIHNHAINYIEDCLNKITNTKIVISDENTRRKRIITTTYWNNQENSIIERLDFDNDFCDYNELIIEGKIKDSPPVFEVMRVVRENDVLIPIYHGFITEMDDGSQVENKII